jgi:hypothetical protein
VKIILKTHLPLIFLVFLLLASTFLMIDMPVQAGVTHIGTPSSQPNGSILLPSGVTPDVTVVSDVYLSTRPNPVGLGQTILVNIWLDPGPSYARYLSDYKVTLTKPSGATDEVVLDSYPADGTAWFEYTVDEVGTWTLKFEFPGGYFPAGNYTVPAGVNMAGYTESYKKSVYYAPASTPETQLVVQDQAVASWSASPLPTNYWTRPVSPENREWWSILGDYPWYGPGGGVGWPENTNTYWSARYKFTPYVQAPNTAHIVWKRQGAIGGLIGGSQGPLSFTSGGGTPSIIYQGRAYQTVTKVSQTGTGSQTYWQSYDLRTGEIYWERPIYSGETAPSYIEYSENEPAVFGGGSDVGISVSLIAITSNRLVKYNPYTGAVTANISLPTFSETAGSFGAAPASQYYMNGYALSVQIINSTARQWRLINWTTLGTSTNFTTRIMSNISYATNSLGQFQDIENGICFVIREPNALDSTGLNPVAAFPYVDIYIDNATGIRHGMRIMAFSLKTGQMLFNVTSDDLPYKTADMPYSQPTAVADHGKLAVLMRKGYFNVYNELTGQFLFKTQTMDYPWDEPGFGAYDIQSAYGMIYREAYGGIYAFDWDTGDIVWKYTAPANPYETPYTDENGTTVYSWYTGGIVADGKLYSWNSEHTATQPITRGWGIHCIDAYTGKGIWNITGSMSPGAVADGYLTASNSYDGYMYVFGKGKSAITIDAPMTAIPLGQRIIIKGTVLDQSPAQPDTPCVSKDSMGDWLEYLHMQKTIPSNVVGVSVSLDTVDPNGNYVHIGDVTTDGYSGTFGYTWEPEIQGQYTVTATFMGDDSYSSSFATTYVSVTEASQASPTPTSISFESVNNTTITAVIGAAIAIIIAIAIVGLLLLRRK